jgi:uncharacterized membrane protein
MEDNEEIPDPIPDNDDSKWIWGIFYFNPNDKRIFPPKRIRWMGWTVNFTNPYSVAALLLMIAAVTYIRKFL